jgi:cytochrome c biogenesis protein CcmG, thiol:disulfide interchange protein DsbE
MVRKILNGLALAAALAAVYVFAMPTYRHGEPSVAGRQAPDFAFQLNGREARLSDLHGKVVILDFWATWCPPCVQETPSLNALEDRISSRGGMVLGISQDDDASAYQRFLTAHHVDFPTYRDATKGIATDYGTSMFPEAYIIGRDGRIARKIVGPQNWDSPELVADVNSLLQSN